jgi:hypothetical protein
VLKILPELLMMVIVCSSGILTGPGGLCQPRSGLQRRCTIWRSKATFGGVRVRLKASQKGPKLVHMQDPGLCRSHRMRLPMSRSAGKETWGG